MSEEHGPLPTELWSAVFTRQEIARLASLPDTLRGFTAKLMFSAKESAYKAIYQLVNKRLDFCGMSIAVAEDGSWHARLKINYHEA